MKRFYFDYAATTPTRPEVIKVMKSFWKKYFGNPSSLYYEGRLAKTALTNARKKIAKIINVSPEEIIFTNGGSESVNLAILGSVNFYKNQFRRPEIIVSQIEHPAVLETAKYLEKNGVGVISLNVNKNGIIKLNELKKKINQNTLLISIMYANNEIGTIQPIQKIARIIKYFRQKNKTIFPLFHTDACQAAGYLDIKPKKLGVDLMSLNGSKIYGPKATGLLYKRKDLELTPIIFGGGQEMDYRSGTENVPGIIGFTKALELSQNERNKEVPRLKKLQKYLIANLLKRIPKIIINGDLKNRLPNNINISILDIEGEALLLKLDELGIAISTGSACHSQSLKPSHVLEAIGLPHEFIHGSLRITLGKYTTKKEVDYLIQSLEQVVQSLRELSPLSLKEK